MKSLKIRSPLVREIFAEFLGTFILMVSHLKDFVFIIVIKRFFIRLKGKGHSTIIICKYSKSIQGDLDIFIYKKFALMSKLTLNSSTSRE